MGTLAFALVCILLATALLVLAMRPGRNRSDSAKPARRLPRSYLVGFAIITVLVGVLVPALLTAEMNDRDSIPEVNVQNLTAQEKEGRILFGQRCRSCHTLDAANSSAAVGPNLDQVRPSREIVLKTIDEGRAQGNGQMPADLVEGEDAEAVAAFVAKTAGAGK